MVGEPQLVYQHLGHTYTLYHTISIILKFKVEGWKYEMQVCVYISLIKEHMAAWQALWNASKKYDATLSEMRQFAGIFCKGVNCHSVVYKKFHLYVMCLLHTKTMNYKKYCKPYSYFIVRNSKIAKIRQKRKPSLTWVSGSYCWLQTLYIGIMYVQGGGAEEQQTGWNW